MTRPVKAELPKYKEIEAPLQEAIWNKWLDVPLTAQEMVQVFQIDDAILAHEFLNLMDAQIISPTPEIFPAPEFSFTGFDTCKKYFLRLFHRLTERT